MTKGPIMGMLTSEKYKQFVVARTWVLERYWQKGKIETRIEGLARFISLNMSLNNVLCLKDHPKDSRESVLIGVVTSSLRQVLWNRMKCG